MQELFSVNQTSGLDFLGFLFLRVLTAFGYRDAETSFLQDPLSVSEISLIKSYREHKEMQPAVHKLLDLQAPVTRTRRKRKPKKSNPEV